MTTIAEYNARALEARIAKANLSPALVKTRAEILALCDSIAKSAAWALDPEEDNRVYWANSMVEYTHELLDLVHDFKNTVKK